MSSANLPNPAGSGGYEELAAIACDPGMRRLAWRLAGDMADDLLQETWYAMARTAARESIGNPRGYFYKTMVNTWRHLRQDLARHGIPADDLDALQARSGACHPPSTTCSPAWTPQPGRGGCGPGGPSSG